VNDYLYYEWRVFTLQSGVHCSTKFLHRPFRKVELFLLANPGRASERSVA